MTSLFDPTTLGRLELPNRVVMSPMSRLRSGPDGLATAAMGRYYAQRAGAGLIISEGIQPTAVGQSNPGQPGLVSEEQAASWQGVTGAVHAAGGRIIAQIMHAGRISHPDTTGLHPEAPSAVAARDARVFTPTGPAPAPVPRALTTAEVPEVAAAIARAAGRALAAGFDGAELHGANGYLIGQFLSDTANRRTDRYGGSVTGRIRFAVEAVEAAVDTVGAGRLGLRLSPGAGVWDTGESDTHELYRALLAALAPLGLGYLHLAASPEEDLLLDLRRRWPGTLVVNPSRPGGAAPTSLADAERWLGRGADLISFGRAFIANPDLVDRLREGAPLSVADEATYYTGGDEGYLDYPTAGRRPDPATVLAR